MDRQNDVGLIIEGGGMRGFFALGALAAMADSHLDFSYIIGNSSGALCAALYACGRVRPDFDALKRINALSLINLPGLFYPSQGLLKTDKVLDLLFDSAAQSFVDQMARERSAHDSDENTTDKWPSDKTVLVPATDALTGKLVWWDIAQEQDAHHLKSIVRASCSIPIVMPCATVDEHPYADGGIVDSIPLDRAIADGHQRNILILTRPKGYRKGPQHIGPYVRASLHRYPQLTRAIQQRHVYYNHSMELVEASEHKGEALVLRPVIHRVARFEYAPDKFKLDFEDGYERCQNMIDQIERFIRQPA